MIEFDGRISGTAEKHMWQRGKRFTIIIMIASLITLSPLIILLWLDLESLFGVSVVEIPVLYGLFSAIVLLLIWIWPISKKEKNDFGTCKVFTVEEYIVAVSGNGNEIYKLISKAKCLTDYGDFYEIVFPLSAGLSNDFICQKNLLTSGTLEEFEELFKGKIVRK